MNSFTISQLQRYSGINVHSIRAWEKRYNALQPERSEGNTRYYSGNQLRRLLNIGGLMNLDYKISELCAMPDSKLNELMSRNLEKETSNNNDELLISQLVVSALEFSEPLFDKIFSRALIRFGVEGTYVNLIYPALQRLGVMWLADKIAPAQEHFITNLIRQKLNTATDLLPTNESSKNHWLQFLPENEFHDTGLLFSNYLVRNAGHRCTYLGANVPHDALKEAVKMIKPTALLCFLVTKDDVKQDEQFVQQMMKSFPLQKIFVAAEQGRLGKIESGKKFTHLKSIQDLNEELKMMSK